VAHNPRRSKPRWRAVASAARRARDWHLGRTLATGHSSPAMDGPEVTGGEHSTQVLLSTRRNERGVFFQTCHVAVSRSKWRIASQSPCGCQFLR
jgi:hypothetical protein